MARRVRPDSPRQNGWKIWCCYRLVRWWWWWCCRGRGGRVAGGVRTGGCSGIGRSAGRFKCSSTAAAFMISGNKSKAIALQLRSVTGCSSNACSRSTYFAPVRFWRWLSSLSAGMQSVSCAVRASSYAFISLRWSSCSAFLTCLRTARSCSYVSLLPMRSQKVYKFCGRWAAPSKRIWNISDKASFRWSILRLARVFRRLRKYSRWIGGCSEPDGSWTRYRFLSVRSQSDDSLFFGSSSGVMIITLMRLRWGWIQSLFSGNYYFAQIAFTWLERLPYSIMFRKISCGRNALIGNLSSTFTDISDCSFVLSGRLWCTGLISYSSGDVVRLERNGRFCSLFTTFCLSFFQSSMFRRHFELLCFRPRNRVMIPCKCNLDCLLCDYSCKPVILIWISSIAWVINS